MPKQNVPALRLKGFSGEWELKAIGELFAERHESFPEGELLSVTLRNGIKRFQEIGRHNTSNEDKSKYKLVEVGDIAYNSMRMWQGASGVSPWKGIVSPAYTVLKPVGSQDTPFFAYYFKTPFMVQEFQLNSQGLTSDTWNLKYPALSAIDIYRPQDIEEQQAIGAIFTNLDAAINQHTLKHMALQQAKTALMQRMFPQEGQTVPELRLEGFEGEWETTSVSAVADVVGGGTPSTSNPSFWDGDIDWYSPNEVGSDVVAKPSNRRITIEGMHASSAQLLPAHRTILYTSRASIGHAAILKHPATTNQGFQSLILRDGMDTYFMYSLTPLITRKALKIASGSTFLEISAKALGTIEISVPPHLRRATGYRRSVHSARHSHCRRGSVHRVPKASQDCTAATDVHLRSCHDHSISF